MKKFFSTFLALMLTASSLALAVSAAAGKGDYGDVPLYKGGITVDGKIDAAYTKLGLKVEINGDYPNIPSESFGNAYFLHDGANLYVAMQIKNSHPLIDYGKTISTDSWADDGCEFYIDFKGDASSTMSKWVCWYDGQYTTGDENANKDALKAYKATKVDAQTYIMEFQFAFAEGAKTGSDIGWYVMANSNSDPKNPKQEFIAVPTIMNGVTGANKPAEWANMTLSATEVKMPEVTTAATQKAPTSTGTSAATFDAAIVMAVVAAAAGAGVVVSKKRK